MNEDVRKKFFFETEHTGRFVVQSYRTGKKYFIEPIGDPHIAWGSIDPATGDLRNKKGAGKYRGSITADESLITESNGFKNIELLGPGCSPMMAIEARDAKYPTIER